MGFLRCLLFLLTATVCRRGIPAGADFQSAAAHTRTFQLATNLSLKVWATEPLLANGVAFSFDPDGSAWIAETHRYGTAVRDITQNTSWLTNDLHLRTVAQRERFLLETFGTNRSDLTRNSELVRRVTDSDGDGVADRSEIMATGFNTPADGTAAGILSHGQDVWFANIPNLWRLTLDPSRSRVASRQSVAMGFGVHIGVTGHDLHGLTVGPDGRIYVSWGDRGFDPSTAPQVNLHGFDPEVLRDTGGVLRCEPDGTKPEIFCIGLRNPQELAFDEAGNLWTSDNDTAGKDPCRVLHLIPGGDYGWRCSYQHLENFGPWVSEELWRGGMDGILPPAGTVAQGPSGLAYYPGTGFGDRFKGQFLHCDFPGGIMAFSVRPHGSTYLVDKSERLLWNCWPTDVDFGPDGALYVLDWISGWTRQDRGRIYRVTPAEGLHSGSKEVMALLGKNPGDVPDSDWIRLLDHPDLRVRQRAHSLLAGRGGESTKALRDVAAAGSTRAATHAVWSLSMIARKMGTSEVDPEWLARIRRRNSDEVSGSLALFLGESDSASATAELSRMASDPSPRVRILVLQSLLQRAWKFPSLPASHWISGAEAILQREDPDAFVESLLSRLLATEETMDTTRLWARRDNPRFRRVGMLAYRWRHSEDLADFLGDPDPEVSRRAARAIHDTGSTRSLAVLAGWIAKVDLPSDWTLRCIHAVFRTGSDKEARQLAAFAARRDISAEHRAAALDALGDWKQPQDFPGDGPPKYPMGGLGNHPGGLDRVSGAHRPLISPKGAEVFRRNSLAAQRALLAQAGVYFSDNSPEVVQRAALDAIRRLNAREAAENLANRFANTNTPVLVRRGIVTLLSEWRSAHAADVLQAALAGPIAELRAAALPHLALLGESAGGNLLRQFVKQGIDSPTGENLAVAQAALARLDRKQPGFEQWMDEILAGSGVRIPDALQLEFAALLDRDSRDSERLSRLFPNAVLPTDPVERKHWGTLQGGSTARGESVFREKAETQCARCHAIGPSRPLVGPALDDVGKRLSRVQILESILHPNRNIAAGFESVVLEIPDADDVVGRVEKETDAALSVITAGGESVTVEKSKVRRRSSAASAMPDGLGEFLSPMEMRDLVEFLATRGQAKAR